MAIDDRAAGANSTTSTDDASDRPTTPSRAKGRAPRLTDARLAKLAEITPDEIAEAAAWWAEVAPAKYRGLIGAKAEGE